MKDKTLLRINGIWAIVVLLIVDSIYWRIDHAILMTGFTIIGGIVGYTFGITVNKKDKGNKGDDINGRNISVFGRKGKRNKETN